MSDNSRKKEDNIEDAIILSESGKCSAETEQLGFLMEIILDYYGATGDGLVEGDEWKLSDPENYKIPNAVEVPGDLDKEIKRAFITQVKKYQ